MENIINREQLNSTRKNQQRFTSLLNESKQDRILKAFSNKVTVFLSHYHGDTDILENVICELHNLGVNVYVDWNDIKMPKETNFYTAIRIKEKIKECRKFILLATESAIESKWCNWELGYGDAIRYDKKDIAIMPIKDSLCADYKGSEYMGMYPVITNEYMATLGKYYVEFRDTKMLLSEWLKQ